MAASDHTPRAIPIAMANNFGIGIDAFIGPFTVCHHFHIFFYFSDLFKFSEGGKYLLGIQKWRENGFGWRILKWSATKLVQNAGLGGSFGKMRAKNGKW
jgi:hypothetical protein